VLALLRQQVRQAGAACLLVTHSATAAAQADRVLRLTSEGIEHDGGRAAPTPAPASSD
jgi:putative ABC transport system ATP-binding protein